MKITLKRAIQVLSLNLEKASKKMPEETAASVAVGIEAIHRLQDNRRNLEVNRWILLPSEQEE